VQSLTDWTTVSIELFYGIAQSMLLEQPCDVSTYAQKAATLARWCNLIVNLNTLLCLFVLVMKTMWHLFIIMHHGALQVSQMLKHQENTVSRSRLDEALSVL